MNYQGQRLISHLRKENKLINAKYDEEVTKNAHLRADFETLKKAGTKEGKEGNEAANLVDDLKISKELFEVSEEENKELREKIEFLNGKVSKKVDQGPTKQGSGPNRGGKGGTK